MATVLDKEQSRKRIGEVRALWNSWDPIGVASDEVQDEYDAYLAPTVRLLERHAPVDEIVEYLKWVTNNQMGLLLSSGHKNFAERLQQWFDANWKGTRVPGV